MARQVADTEDLEQLLESIERREAIEEEDAEVALEGLIEDMADIRTEPAPIDPPSTEDLTREDEFVCRVQQILNRVCCRTGTFPFALTARRSGPAPEPGVRSHAAAGIVASTRGDA